MNPKVDAFLGKEKKWQDEFQKLRTIVLARLSGKKSLILQRFLPPASLDT